MTVMICLDLCQWSSLSQSGYGFSKLIYSSLTEASQFRLAPNRPCMTLVLMKALKGMSVYMYKMEVRIFFLLHTSPEPLCYENSYGLDCDCKRNAIQFDAE